MSKYNHGTWATSPAAKPKGREVSYHDCYYCFASGSMQQYLTRLGKPTLFCSACATRVYINGANWTRGPSLWWDFIHRIGAVPLTLFFYKHQQTPTLASSVVEDQLRMDVEIPMRAAIKEMEQEANEALRPLDAAMAAKVRAER